MNKKLRWIAMPLLVVSAAWAAHVAPSGPQPKAIKRVDPEFPFALELHGNRGEVLIEFTVDETGVVRDPIILKSSHPEFEAPAVEALLEWKFEPGKVEGRPVAVRMQQSISFGYVGMAGTDAFTVPERAPKWLPEAYQYDKPPKPVLTAAPVYPLDLLNQNVKGSATVAFLIDPEGRTRQVIVKKATHPAFGAATVAMISAWEFEPARKNGRPSWAVLSRKQAFSRGGRDSPVNRSTGRLLRALSQEPGSIFNTTGELDRVPKPRYQPAPVVPESMLERAEPASAEIEFIIDRTGRAQLPRIVSATREDFGWAAATAVARWQFTPPTKHGKPVDVKARVPLKYVPPPEGVTEPAARPTP